MRFLPLSSFGVALLVSSSFTAFAHAQTTATEDDERVLETIEVGEHLYSDQVNAIKAPTPIIDVPQSLSIISSDQINQRGFDSIGDIINYTPGVNTSQGEGHRDAVVFRGVRSTADFFVDGVRDDVQYYRPLYNLEQVEILRGPNALLFGRGGTGGVINRVTKKGVLDEQFVGYQAGIDTFGAFDGSVDANFAVSDNAAIRVNAYYQSMENHRDFFDGDNYGINPTARFALTPDTTLDLSYEYANHERFIDRGIPINDLDGGDFEPIEAFKDITFGDAELNTTEFEAHILRATLQHAFNDQLKGNFTVAYGDYDKMYQNFYAADLVDIDTVELDGYVDTTQRQRLTLAGNLVGEFLTGKIRHTLIGGAELLDTSNDNDRFNPVFSETGTDREEFSILRPLNFSGGAGLNAAGVATTMTFSDLNDDTESDVEVMSFYVQDQIEINQYFDVLLGLRADSFDQSTGTVSRKDDYVSPRAGVIFKPKENVSIYASYSETFLPRSGEQFASTGSLDPDEFEQTEIGVKWDVADTFSLTAAYFQNDQTRADRDDDTGEDFEIRGLEIEGFELQLQGNVTDRWFISAGYSFLEGETDNGNEIPRELPENTFSIWNAFQATDRLGLGLGLTYQDESFITDLDIGSDASTHPTLPAYTRLDASAFYELNDDLTLRLNIENLTDETYFPNAHSTHQVTVGAPLNARLSVSGKF